MPHLGRVLPLLRVLLTALLALLLPLLGLLVLSLPGVAFVLLHGHVFPGWILKFCWGGC
jgi:hypothetical protein